MTIPGLSGRPQATAPAHPAPASTAVQPPVQPAAPPLAAPAPSAPVAAKVRIALVLPLSGVNAKLGNAMLDAAQMALYDVADQNLELVPLDTKGTVQGAATAAQAAVAAGAKLIIGPLIAAEVAAVKPVARGAGIPVLAFST
jgi:branched-chain amino acid transport system substrate-binding protein